MKKKEQDIINEIVNLNPSIEFGYSEDGIGIPKSVNGLFLPDGFYYDEENNITNGNITINTYEVQDEIDEDDEELYSTFDPFGGEDEEDVKDKDDSFYEEFKPVEEDYEYDDEYDDEYDEDDSYEIGFGSKAKNFFNSTIGYAFHKIGRFFKRGNEEDVDAFGADYSEETAEEKKKEEKESKVSPFEEIKDNSNEESEEFDDINAADDYKISFVGRIRQFYNRTLGYTFHKIGRFFKNLSGKNAAVIDADDDDEEEVVVDQENINDKKKALLKSNRELIREINKLFNDNPNIDFTEQKDKLNKLRVDLNGCLDNDKIDELLIINDKLKGLRLEVISIIGENNFNNKNAKKQSAQPVQPVQPVQQMNPMFQHIFNDMLVADIRKEMERLTSVIKHNEDNVKYYEGRIKETSKIIKTSKLNDHELRLYNEVKSEYERQLEESKKALEASRKDLKDYSNGKVDFYLSTRDMIVNYSRVDVLRVYNTMNNIDGSKKIDSFKDSIKELENEANELDYNLRTGKYYIGFSGTHEEKMDYVKRAQDRYKSIQEKIASLKNCTSKVQEEIEVGKAEIASLEEPVNPFNRVKQPYQKAERLSKKAYFERVNEFHNASKSL